MCWYDDRNFHKRPTTWTKFECTYCNKVGHMSANCYRRKHEPKTIVHNNNHNSGQDQYNNNQNNRTSYVYDPLTQTPT